MSCVVVNEHTVVVKSITITNLSGKRKTYSSPYNAMKAYVAHSNDYSRSMRRIKGLPSYKVRRLILSERVLAAFTRMLNK